MTQKACKYLIMAGGTGGHIFPAMAVARSLRERGAEIYWLGTAMGMEHRLVPVENMPLHLIRIAGFRGKGFLSKLLTSFLLLVAIIQAINVIRKIKPNVVVGFGGYVAAPGGIAAKLLGVKLIVHEQNSVAGSTNKLLSKIASCTLEAFPNSLPGANRVGNPIRKDISDLFAIEKTINSSEKRKLLIMGGSLGAASINQIMPEVMSKFSPEYRPEVWHQAGKNKHAELVVAYETHGVVARVDEFIADVAAAYRWADIILCRAGALTVSEAAAAGIPAIFIPFPYAIDNHQFHNAQWLVENDAAYLIEQKNLTAEKLAVLLEKMLSDVELLKTMSVNIKKLAMPDATKHVVAVCEQACRGESLLNKDSIGEKNNAA